MRQGELRIRFRLTRKSWRRSNNGKNSKGGNQNYKWKKKFDKRKVKCCNCNNYGHFANEHHSKKKSDDEVNLAEDDSSNSEALSACDFQLKCRQQE